MTKSDKETFDAKCFEELCAILNKNDKWKSVANELDKGELGYQHYVEIWQNSPNPTKVLLTFVEVSNIRIDN